MVTSSPQKKEEKDRFLKLTQQAIQAYREKLLDISNRNNLINLNFNPRSNRVLRIIDELPEAIFKKLSENDKLTLISLPASKNNPKDEATIEFKKTFEEERLVNENYLNELKELNPDDEEIDESSDEFQKILRKLKDEIRKKLGLKKIPTQHSMSIQDYAKAHNIVPEYDNPKVKSEIDERHDDDNLQTLFYPDDLERKARAILKHAKSFLDEKGTNTLHLSFGCLKWLEANNTPRYSPLLLMQVKIVETKTPSGPVYTIESTEGELFINLSLEKKLINDFKIQLPKLEENENIESYFKKIELQVLKTKPDWELKRFITLAIHTYSKMSMYAELDPKKWNTLGNQAAIQTLFTGSDNPDHDSEIYDVDEAVNKSKVPILIEETDSSQFSVILDAMNGENLAVQGPPGTGKSTTITNIIASYLFKQKKVLFIAEKKTALDVVYKKLKDKDLDKFVFRLSSTAEKKTSIIDEIKDRLTIKAPKNIPDSYTDQKEYNEQINKIRSYGKILDTEYFAIKKTGYQILSNLSKYKFYLENYPKKLQDGFVLPDIHSLNKDDFIRNLGQISEVSTIISNIKKKFKDIGTHPWFGLIEDKNNPYEIKELKSTIIKLDSESKNINEKLKIFFNSIKVKFNIDFIDAKKVINIFSKSPNKTSADIKNLIVNFDEVKKIELLQNFLIDLTRYDELLKVKKKLSKIVNFNKAFKIPKLKEHLTNIKKSIFLLSYLFNANYRQSKKFFIDITKDIPYTKNSSIEIIEDLLNYLKLEKDNEQEIKQLKNNYLPLSKLIGDNFKSEKTDLNIIKDINNFFIFSASENQILINKNIKNIEEIKKISSDIEVLLNSFETLYSAFSPKINSKHFFNFDNENIVFENIFKKIKGIDLRDDESLSEYIELNYYNKNLNKNVQNLYDIFVQEQLDFKFLDYAYKFLIYNSLAKKLFETKRELSSYLSSSLENEVSKLRSLDKKIFSNQNDQLIQNLSFMEITPGTSKGKASDLTELSLIKRETDKKRAHIPFRQLMQRAGNALRDMKPCYMLSPASLSQVVNAEPEIFDVLIIDEASQMKIEDAIGSILRAKQVIIVGDPMQLPPSDFFNAGSELDTEDGIVDDDESILDLALSRFQSRMLRWHYRSRHESLINFSNFHFYNKDLIIPPSAIDKFAIKNNYIENAIYTPSSKTTKRGIVTGKTGVNILEANAISDAVVDFMKNSIKKSSNKSCLVVTMNTSQKELIEEEIRFKSSKIPEVEEYLNHWLYSMEPFAVKNLESVQGDERDYIFVSTLFGPNKDGITMKRFGPIAKPKGHRRLNVLFTRAKEGLELFTSLTPSSIGDGGEKGRQIFKSYLEYAQTQRIESGITTSKGTDSDFEDWVKGELENLGYEVMPQVGVSGFFIDLGIKHKDYKYGYLAGVECDGAAYHSSVSARDNDITRQNVLEGLGWNIYRIWSTNWFENPKAELKKLDHYLKALIKNQ